MPSLSTLRGPPRVLALAAACALGCGPSAPLPEAPRPTPPTPEAVPDRAPPELGWRYGGCSFELAREAFGDVPLDVAWAAVHDAAVVCRVEALVPGRAADATLFTTNDGDVPDLAIGARFGAGGVQTRLGPDNAPAALFVFAPVTLAPGDEVAFYAVDRDAGSKDDWLGDVRASVPASGPLAVKSDSLAVDCAPIPPPRLAVALDAVRVDAARALDRFAAAGLPAALTDADPPESESDARMHLRCMSSLAGPTPVRAELDRYGAALERWRSLVRARIDADLAAAVAGGGPLQGSPVGVTLAAPRCGDARLPDDPSWGISDGDAAGEGRHWCFVALSFDNAGSAAIDVAPIAGTAPRPEALAFDHVVATLASGQLRVCAVQIDDLALAAGAKAARQVACDVARDDAVRALRLTWHIAGATHSALFALPR